MKSVIEDYEGREVKVYLSNGRVMVGTAHIDLKSGFIKVINEQDGLEVVVNTNHIISISPR